MREIDDCFRCWENRSLGVKENEVIAKLSVINARSLLLLFGVLEPWSH